jgi:hypothetical protein
MTSRDEVPEKCPLAASGTGEEEICEKAWNHRRGGEEADQGRLRSRQVLPHIPGELQLEDAALIRVEEIVPHGDPVGT